MQSFVGCYHVTVRQGAVTPAMGGALGDSLPNPFIVHLTPEPVPPAQDPQRRGGRYADWEYLPRGMGLTAWWLADDTLHVYSVMYGWVANMTLTGSPGALSGAATVATHRDYHEAATLHAVTVSCPDSGGG